MEYNVGNNNKRKFDNDEDNNEYEYVKVIKKPKFEIDDSLVYAIGKEIHFTAGINNNSIERVIKLITKIIYEHESKHKNEKKKLNITIVIDSNGGSVLSILKYVDYIKLTKKKHPNVTYTSIINGLAASAGTIMAVCADKRLMTRNAFSMVHELSTGHSSSYTKFMSYSEHLKTMHNILLDIYMTVAKPSREEMEKILNTETWYDAEGYKSIGLIDEII
jgi:ATP-dependent protease ClpP protease subunit